MYDGVQFVHMGKFISRGAWKHPDRMIDTTELIFVLQGEVYLTQGETEYHLTAGQVLRLDPGIRHYGTRETENVSFYWLHLTQQAQAVPTKCFFPTNAEQSQLLFRQLLHYSNTEEFPKEGLHCLLRVLLMELNTSQAQRPQAGYALYAAVRAWIKSNADLPLQVCDVAEHFRYNEDYLNRVFRRFYPKGLKAWMDEAKLQHIRSELLTNDLSLQALSEKYGFENYKYFLKYFKYHEGITPTAYRRMYANTHINHK